MAINRICFDIETEPFSNDFSRADSLPSKQKHAPKMRVACVYIESRNTYEFFTQDDVSSLIALLQSADEIITFNGKGFDVLVLRKHYGLKGKVPLRGKHTDLHEVLTARAGFRVSLDKASRLNLNEGKHTFGREMSNLDMVALKEACKSDVSQTYRLWLANEKGELRAPERATPQFGVSDLIGGPGHHMPSLCPVCHDVGSIVFIESDMEGMTDGQFAEYMAGTQGFAACTTCNSLVVWDV